MTGASVRKIHAQLGDWLVRGWRNLKGSSTTKGGLESRAAELIHMAEAYNNGI